MAAEVDLNSLGTDNETQETVVDDNTLPESYSSLDLGYCSDVKYQDGNICWVYASIASLESLFIKEGFLTADPDFNNDLSESLLDQWGTYEENGEGWQRSSKESGYTNISIGYLTSWNGPYTENGIYTNLGVTSLVYLGKNEMSKIKEMIMQSGAVTANFNSHSYAYSKDKNSYCLTDEISEILGHTVSVVGWDDNYSKENFDGNYQPENDGAWLCKNSWGSNNNSIGGYLWISYEDYYLFNDDYFDPSFGIDTYQKIDDNDYLYQNEKYGATYEFKYVSGDDITYYNVFDFSENGNVLDKIIFESTAKGAEYSVYFTPVDENGTPVSDKTKWQFLSSGTVDYRGYICCDIEDTTVSQCKGAIAVEIDTSAIDKTDGSNITSSLGVCEWLRDRESQQMILVHQGQRGQSYIDYNGGIYDIMDVYNDLGDSSGGTFVIKAVTNGTVDTTTLGDVNLDGKANINDATLIQKYINKNVINLVDHQLVNADYNKDGKIDINDVTAIQKNMAK
jgi:C1A family cysteine protease